MANTLPSAASYAGLGAPAFQYRKVWSATDPYYFYPSAVWDDPTNKIIFTQKNHNLTSSDVVSFIREMPVAEVQQVVVDATSGTFEVTYSGQTTAALAFNVSAVNFTTAMTNLSNVEVGDVVVTGGPGNNGGTTPYVLTWRSGLGNVAQVTCADIDLAGGGDTVTPSTITQGSDWNLADQTITVVDADTFTTPQLVDPGTFPAGIVDGVILNNSFMITCMKYSKLMFSPSVIQGDTLPAATTIVIEGKVHPNAAWVSLGQYTLADGNFGLTISPRYNFVRGRRSVGTGQPVIYAQY